MFAKRSLKFKIVVSMVILSFTTTVIASCVGIVKSSQIISNNAKESFTTNAEVVSEKIYKKFFQVENNTLLIEKFILESTTSLKSKSDMNKLRMEKDYEYSKIRPYVRVMAENIEGTQSGFFYFDQNYIPAYDGSWFIREDGKFKRQISNSVIGRDESNTWYYNPVDTQLPCWSEAYTDADIGVSMITYSKPIYKNGFLLGVAGMDIALDDLNKILGEVKIYKNNHAFLIDSDFRFIANTEFEAGESALDVKNGAYKFLEKEVAKSDNGFSQYKDGKTTKVLSYSKLPNGFILVIEVPLKNIPTNMLGTVLLLLFLGGLTIFVTCILALRLGEVLSKPINEVVYSLSSYAKKLSTGSDTYLALSQKLAEGSNDQAASVQETSATLEESSAMVEQSNQSTKQAVLLASKTKDISNTGGEQMQEVVTTVMELKKSSQSISKITKIIDDIATQTNILALNAAVEAARAGAAGGGFAVVAEEVRTLSMKTAEATRNISDIVDTNINLSSRCENLTKKANEILNDINLQAEKVNELLNEIASSTNEQSIGVSQISLAMSNIEKVVSVNATYADTISQISVELLDSIQTGIGEIEMIVNGSTKNNNNY